MKQQDLQFVIYKRKLIFMNSNSTQAKHARRQYVYSTALLAMVFSLIISIAFLCVPSPIDSAAQAAEGNQPVMIQAGHADFGPTLIDSKWKLKIRDDTGDEPVWRDPENVVFKLGSNSIIAMPDDAAYSFIGEKPGTKLYVIPQTQNPDVPWLGWNTQEGGVLNELDRGANLSLEGVSGPGKLHVYLENGNNNPQQLWDSTKGYPQNSWIEANAHTHVNWVFSKPGIYHVKLTFSGKLKNGRSVSDTRVLNFAVGDNTDPNAALSASADSHADDDGQSDDGAQDADNTQGDNAAEGNSRHHAHSALNHKGKNVTKNDDTTLALQLIGVFVAVIAVIIVIFVCIAVMKSKKAREEALAQQDSLQHAQQTVKHENSLSNLVREQETTVMAPINTHTAGSGASQFDSSSFDSSSFDSSQWK